MIKEPVMVSPQPRPPVPATGLPPGVERGPLDARFVAFLIDAAVPALILAVAFGVAGGAVRLVLSLLVLGWAVLVCHMLALRAASPGMRLMRLQLVGFSDGRPVGWSRVLIRAALLLLLAATGVGLVVLGIFLVQHPRRAGWHDLMANAVVIRERAVAPAQIQSSVAAKSHSAVVPDVAIAAKGTSALPEAPPPAAVDGHNAQMTAEAATPVIGDPHRELTTDTQRTANQAKTSPATANQPTSTPSGVMLASSEPDTPTGQAAGLADSAGDAVTRDVGPRDWVAVLDDGREITVNALVLLGRNPQARPGEDDAELIKIADQTRTVSKTHLALGIDAKGMYVMDRGSTNGSTLTNARGVSRPCPAGEMVGVAAGNIISFGEHWLEVRRDT